jgi:hypothetical protein
MDAIQKQVGYPYSTSRKWEKAMKKRTNKKRRVAGKTPNLAQALGLDSISDRWN